jgi:hypothetical protein
LFTQRANGAGRRRTNEDFQVIRLPLHRLYPHHLPTEHQLFHRGVIAEISVRWFTFSLKLRESLEIRS